MMKYILPAVNGVILCTTSLLLNIREGTPVIGVLLAMIMLIATVYQMNLIQKNGSEIKIEAFNKIMTLASIVLTAGCLYEVITGNIISDEEGDYMAMTLVVIGVGIWVHDYFIKPFKINR